MYTRSKVKEIIKNYKHYTEQIQAYNKEYASVGVTVYDENAVMPRANKISDVTANEAISQLDDIKIIADMKTDIKYLQDRLYRVDKHADILDLYLCGLTTNDIAAQLYCSTRTIEYKLDMIADSIISAT